MAASQDFESIEVSVSSKLDSVRISVAHMMQRIEESNKEFELSANKRIDTLMQESDKTSELLLAAKQSRAFASDACASIEAMKEQIGSLETILEKQISRKFDAIIQKSALELQAIIEREAACDRSADKTHDEECEPLSYILKNKTPLLMGTAIGAGLVAFSSLLFFHAF